MIYVFMNVIHTYIYNYGTSSFLRGKTHFLIGKTSINGPFSIAMLSYQRVLLDLMRILGLWDGGL